MTKLIHGHTGKNGNFLSPTYRSWLAMKQRCLNKNHKSYKKYHNIKICERWIDSFKDFLTDMGERPLARTIDRIDNNKGYYKKNCKWSTMKEQENNRNNNVVIKYKNKNYTVETASKTFGITPGSLYSKLKKYPNDIEYCLGLKKKYPNCSEIILPKGLKRNQEIIFFRKNGCRLKDIADEYNLTHQMICVIVNNKSNLI